MTLQAFPGWRLVAGLAASAALFGLYARGGLLFPLGFLALVPWLLALEHTRTLRGALASGIGFSVLFGLAVFAWFGIAVGDYVGIGSTIGLLALVVAAPLLQLQIVVFALVRHVVGRHHGPPARALAGAAAWVATEWLWPKLLGDSLGHGVYPSAWLRQVADLAGVAGITFLMLLVNEALAQAVLRRRQPGAPWLRPLGTATTMVAVMLAYGASRHAAFSAPTPDAKPVRMGLVQANITHYERLRQEIGAYETVRLVLDTHYAMTRDAVQQRGVDAVAWSETVYPTTFANPKSPTGAELDRELAGFARAMEVPMVFGTYDRDPAGEYNAAAFMDPREGLLGFYRKTHPFPLTEYVPVWLDGPTLRRLLPWTGQWRAGDGARVFPLRLRDGREVPVVPLICLDDVNPGVALDGARLGAQAIVGMSNDSWFTDYPVGAELHLTVAAFRSIETRLPQVRVTANGYSAVITPTGEVTARTAMGERTLLVGEFTPRDAGGTLVMRWGEWLGPASLIALLAWWLMGWWRGRATRRARTADIASRRADALVGALLPTAWRVLAGALRLAATLGAAWLAVQVLTRSEDPIGQITLVRLFVVLVALPWLAAWAIGRAHAATLHVMGGTLMIELRDRRIEVPASAITSLRAWRVPLPGGGLTLQAQGAAPLHLAGIDPRALEAGLASSGRSPTAVPARAAHWWSAWATTRHAWLDHPLVKFVLFPLVPALPAFRLHQVIAYGGTFGEYYTYGLKAWLLGLLLWWASWAANLALIATGLRALVEAGTAATVLAAPGHTARVRRGLMTAARALYFVGIPAWLAWRLWPW